MGRWAAAATCWGDTAASTQAVPGQSRGVANVAQHDVSADVTTGGPAGGGWHLLPVDTWYIISIKLNHKIYNQED